jgi:RNA polymerase sigma factor (sigma-70 family)
VYEAVIKVWRSVGSFDSDKGTLRGWFFRTAQRQVIDRLRGRQVQERLQAPLDHDPPDESEQEPTPQVERMVGLLARAIEDLPPLQRQIVEADLAAGGQADEQRLADRHRTSVNSIRVSRNKALSNLERWFHEQGYEVEGRS